MPPSRAVRFSPRRKIDTVDTSGSSQSAAKGTRWTEDQSEKKRVALSELDVIAVQSDGWCPVSVWAVSKAVRGCIRIGRFKSQATTSCRPTNASEIIEAKQYHPYIVTNDAVEPSPQLSAETYTTWTFFSRIVSSPLTSRTMTHCTKSVVFPLS